MTATIPPASLARPCRFSRCAMHKLRLARSFRFSRCATPVLPHGPLSRPGRPLRSAFTLVEALVAMTLAMVAASSMMVASYSTMFQMTDGTDRMLAMGIARQLMAEIMGQSYCEKGVSPYQTTLGPHSSEPSRRYYDDIDDYAGYTCSPITDRWGVQLGAGNDTGGNRDSTFRLSSVYFSTWRATVTVKYVAENNWMTNLPAGVTSGFRAVEIVVTKTEQGASRELARLRRVVAYVPNV